MTNPHKELLPCPFCGCKGKTFRTRWSAETNEPIEWGVGCCAAAEGNPNCGVQMPPYFQTEAKAIAAWNRRAVPSPNAEWRSMESAPKDIQIVLAHYSGIRLDWLHVGWWGHVSWVFKDGGLAPTNWMPLPIAPKALPSPPVAEGE